MEVKQFLEELELEDLDKFKMVQNILKDVKSVCSNIKERMMYGGIMFSVNTSDIGGVFVRKNHISIEFSSGHKMSDPKKVLEGTGKFRRHIKIRNISDIKEKNVLFYLKQMIE